MVLYHAVTYYQLLWVFVYHMTKNKGKKGVIILANSLETRLSKETISKLRDYFEIRFFPYNLVKDHINTNTNEELVSQVSKQVCDLYKNEFSYDLREFEEINVAGYHFYFSLLLIENNVPFNIIEEGAGMLSHPEVLYSIVEQLNPYQLKIALESKLLYADHELIDKRFCRVDSQAEDFQKENLVNFDLMEHMKNNDKLTEDIIDVFIGPVSKYTNESDSVLLLTQHFANLKILSFESQALIYQYIVDYFFPDKQLIIKPHPDDVMFYNKLFPEAKIIREKFPSELLPFLFENIPDTVSTVSSTAAFNIENIFRNKVIFSNYTEQEFVNINRYYVAIKLLTSLHDYKEVQCVFCDETMVENIMTMLNSNININVCNSMEEIDFSLPVIIGKCPGDFFSIDICGKEIDVEGVFLLNYDCKYKTCSKVPAVSNMYLPVKINKEQVRDEYFYGDKNDEVFYFVSTVEENRKCINGMKVEKNLNYTGMKMSKKELSNSEIELMVTKGILQATEMRLEFVLEQNKEYLSQIEELKKYR